MIKKLLILILYIIIILSCDKIEPIQDNPLDSDNPDYDSPSVTLISAPTEGETINVYDISLSWTGNENVTDYRWKFEDGAWVDWSNITSVDWYYLDEGQHSFSLQSRYSTGDTSSILTRSFIVDAVEGPALMFYPRAHFISSDTVITFKIMAEEVANLTAADFSINYDPDHVEITSVTQGTIFTASEESIFFTEYDNSTGTLSVLTANLGGDEPAVSGTGVLIEIQMNVISTSSSELTFDGSETFRDALNNSINISATVNGLVTSQ